MRPQPQNPKSRLIIWIVGLAVFAAATLWINFQVKVNVQGGGKGAVNTMGNVAVGETAPDFSILDLTNHSVSLADYRGKKVVLLDFWATWCGPCRLEMVNLQALQDKFKDRNLEILSVDQGEDATQVSPFISQIKYGFHVLLDSDQKVAATYGVRGIPTLVLIDQNGVIQWIKVGYTEDDQELEQKVGSLTVKSDLITK